MTGIVVDSPRPAVEWVTSLPSRWRVTESERLILLCLAADAYRWESAPGYEAIAEWTGMQRTSCIKILGRLCEQTEHRPALLERISVKGRRRTVWRLLADEPVEDVDRFTEPERRPQPSPNRSRPPTGSRPEPVEATDRFEPSPNQSPPSTGSGSEAAATVAEPSPNRSTPSTAPFALNPKTNPNPSPAAAAGGGQERGRPPAEPSPLRPPQDDTPAPGIGIRPPSRSSQDPSKGPSQVQVLVAAYADRVPGQASRSLLGAVGRAAKRLIETDGFDPALILAAIEEAAPQGRRDLDRIVAAPGGPATRFQRHDARRAMFAHWAETAARIDARATA